MLTKDELDEMWAFTLNMPKEWRENIGKACAAYHELEIIHQYLDAVPKVIEYFTEKGRPELIDYYLRYCASPHMESGSKSKFPVCDPEAVFKEMEALYEYGDLKDDLMAFANFLFNKRGVESTFLKDSSAPELGSALPMHSFVEQVLEDYPDHEKIKEILRIPFDYPRLGPESVFPVVYYKHIDENFPGGMQEFIKFIVEIRPYIYTSGKTGHDFFMSLTSFVRIAPKENLERFWALGKRVIKYLREDSTPYLYTKNHSPVLKELLDKDFDAFEKIILEGMNVAFQMSVVMPDRTGDADSKVFEAYLKFYGDPKFDNFVDGLKILIHESAFYVDRVKGKIKQKEISDKLDMVIDMYLSESVDKTDKDSPAKLRDHDNRLHALAFKLSGFENVFVLDDEKINECRDESLEMTNAHVLYDKNFPKERINQLLMILSNSYDYRMTNTLEKHDLLTESLADFDREVTNPPSSVEKAIERVRDDVKATIDLNYWRDILGFDESGRGLKSEGCEEISHDSWIYHANPSTQLAASSGALFLALGLNSLSDDLSELNFTIPDGVLNPMFFNRELDAFASGEIKIQELLEVLRSQDKEKMLKANIQKALPYVVKAIRSARLSYPGLMPIGTKIESCKDLSFKDFRFVLDLAGLGDIRTTPFQLKHNGRSLVNPPLPSAFEQKLLTYFFSMFGVIDASKIDMQVTMGGRMDNEIARVVCASSILASDVSVQYAKAAFSAGAYDGTTDSRIMVYDAGVRKNGLPFDLPNAEGRTDKVACKSMTDIFLLQVLGTFGVHYQFDGQFKDQMKGYKSGFEEILNRHSLGKCISEASWIFDVLEPWDAAEFHEEMIGKFTMARRDNPDLRDEVRDLMAEKLLVYLKSNSQRISEESPLDYERLKTY